MSRGAAVVCAVVMLIGYGCAAGRPVALTTLEPPPCEAARSVPWVGPDRRLGSGVRSAWCESVGPAVIQAPGAESHRDIARNGLIVVTWNNHEGAGDLSRLVEHLSQPQVASAAPAFVILLQEVVRADDRVPRALPAGLRVPARIRPHRAPSSDLEAVARALNLSLAYVPSMRNGGSPEAGSPEDRGSAILSTFPLSDVVGIELPWGSQRRVAVMATVMARKDLEPWSLRVISVHLDNRPSRLRQAAALAAFVQTLPGDGPILIGGDLNSWFGAAERTVRRLGAVVPRVEACGGATFRFGLRLDHLFTTLAPELLSRCEIVYDSFGSDHRPIALRLFQ